MAPAEPDGAAGRFVRVFNTTGFRRHDLASVEVTATERFRVIDPQGRDIPSQVVGGAEGSATLLFPVVVPALGYQTYELAPVRVEQPASNTGGASALKRADGTIILETDLLSIAIDPAKGGRNQQQSLSQGFAARVC